MTHDQYIEWRSSEDSSTLIMGILNVTPGSFSDGGEFISIESAIKHALEMEKEGAHIIDIGGESSRPGADPVSVEEEIERVVPVIKKIRAQSDIMISIDTTKALVAIEAIKAGASMVNDISGMTFDEKMIDVVKEFNVPIVIMHMKGSPKTMQTDPVYHNLIQEIQHYFEERISYAKSHQIKKDQIILDPGIGFGKTVEDNFILIRDMRHFTELGCPVLVGPSRKSFIGRTLDLPENDRLEGTAAAVTASVMNGAKIIRVHDVKEMSRVIKISEKVTPNIV